MALVDWALTCDFAYFDAAGRLCVITRERQGSAVLFHLPRIQLSQLGTYRFELALGAAAPTMLELPVVVREHRGQRVHLHAAY